MYNGLWKHSPCSFHFLHFVVVSWHSTGKKIITEMIDSDWLLDECSIVKIQCQIFVTGNINILTIRVSSITLNHSHQILSTLIHSHPRSSTLIHFHPLSPTLIHAHALFPLLSTLTHSHPRSSTLINSHQQFLAWSCNRTKWKSSVNWMTVNKSTILFNTIKFYSDLYHITQLFMQIWFIFNSIFEGLHSYLLRLDN